MRAQNKVAVGKELMSVELLLALCRWFLALGTLEGVFAYCYLVLTWNLACRAQSTANIRLKNITWTTFDSFEIYFGHTKVDQFGDDTKYTRHLYSNHLCPIASPTFALAVYLSSCFNTVQSRTDYLFPGQNQHVRFARQLDATLKDHAMELLELGYTPNNH